MNYHALFAAFLLAFSACTPTNPNHVPAGKARYRVILELLRPIGPDGKEALPLATKLIEANMAVAGITFKSLKTDKATQKIILEVVDAPGIEAAGRDSKAFFEQKLAIRSEVGFWDVFRVSDQEILEAVPALLEKYQLAGKVRLNTGEWSLSVIGLVAMADKPLFDSILQSPEAKDLFPGGTQFRWGDAGKRSYMAAPGWAELYALKTAPGGGPAVAEKHLGEAKATISSYSSEPVIDLKMTEEGTVLWGKMTEKAAYDNNREVAIVVNGEVVSAPRVLNPILTGQSQISGNFSEKEAVALAHRINFSRQNHQLSVATVTRF